jgi:putative FmdB family regulatory protein
MPTYGYRCENGHEFETFQAMSDPALTTCQQCEAPVRRIFYPVGIVFKGPGFYKTDSRGSSSSSSVPAAPGSPDPGTSAGGGSGGGADDKAGAAKADSGKTVKKDATPPARSDAKPAAGGGDKAS